MAGMITLKAADLKGEDVILFPNFVSNGYWMACLARVTNSRMFASEELCQSFAPGVARVVSHLEDNYAGKGLDVMPRGPLVEIRPTGLRISRLVSHHTGRTRDVAIYYGAGVGFVGLDVKYLAIVEMTGDSLWIKRTGEKDDDLSCAIDTPDRETATIAIMPCTLENVRRWLRAPEVETATAIAASDDTAAGMNDDAAAAL